MMVEIVVTTNKDGTLDAMKILSQRVLVMQLAAHLVEFQWLVGKVAREDAQNVIKVIVKTLEQLWEIMEMIFVHKL